MKWKEIEGNRLEHDNINDSSEDKQKNSLWIVASHIDGRPEKDTSHVRQKHFEI